MAGTEVYNRGAGGRICAIKIPREESRAAEQNNPG